MSKNLKPSAKRILIAAVVLTTMACSPGIAMPVPSDSLLSMHRAVVERLSVLLLDVSRTDESVALVRTLTNKYTERELAEKVFSHGRDLVVLLQRKGDQENARAWDLKLGDALDAIVPGMWQPFFGPAGTSPAMAQPRFGVSANVGRYPADTQQYGANVPMVTAPPLAQAIVPEPANSGFEQARPLPESVSRTIPTRPTAVSSTVRYPASVRSYDANVPRVTAPSLLQEMPPMPGDRVAERAQPISRKSPARSASNPVAPMAVMAGPSPEWNTKPKAHMAAREKTKPELAPAATTATPAEAELVPGVIDKMGFPLSKPLFDRPLVTARPDHVQNGTNGAAPGIIISRESANELKGLNSKIVNLNFKDANIADIVLMLADAGGLNIVSRNEIKGKTTITLSDIPVGTALDLILRTNDYTYQVRDDVVWIFKRGEEPISTKVFFVRNIDVDEVLPAIQRALGQEVGDTTTSENEQFGHSSAALAAAAPKPLSQPGEETAAEATQAGGKEWSVYSDTPSNSLIVTASQSKLEEISRLLKVLDVGNTDYRLEERVFTLKYVDRESFVKTIKMTLPKFDAEKQIIDIKRN